MRTMGFALLAALCTLTWALPSEGASTPAQKCQVAKLKAARKMTSCRLTAMAKTATGGTADLGKCSTKFSTAFGKAEAKAGVGVCPTEGDTATVEVQIDTDTTALQEVLSGVRFVDNGDGTITDFQTGLMWEQKTTAVWSGQNLADPHDVDNSYDWSDGGSDPDGDVFTDFLGKLNACTYTSPTTTTGGFAGHCDWRLPTIAELQTILLTAYPCGTSPCIDPIFGPTLGYSYWSATTAATNSDRAWYVRFTDGYVFHDSKDDAPSQARAVRTGL